ncbi:MAG: glycosyltransferase [Bifidobacteriaceae bacterium]|nr:glycosyltransferase [Bifidobacteriaceae bacterium]
MPHAVYIAWGFPPSRSGGVYRQLATANALARAGWDVTVITVERRVFSDITGADESLEAMIDDRVRVIRSRFPWSLRDQNQAHWSFLHRRFPRLWRKARTAFELAIFPEVGYATWPRQIGRELRRLAQEGPIDLVLASGNPFAGFAAAYRFHRASGTPYVLDYRDSWTLDQFSGQARPDPGGRAAAWERRVTSQAAQVWFVNRATAQWHAARYPAVADRIRVVPNGWDPDLLDLAVLDDPAPQVPATTKPTSSEPATTEPASSLLDDAAPQVPATTEPASAKPASSEPASSAGSPLSQPGTTLTFGYLGTISAKVPVKQLVDGFRLAKLEGLIPPDARLRIAGYLGYFGSVRQTAKDPVAQLIDQAKADGVELTGPVPKMRVAEFYASLDALVLAIDAGPYVTTGKVFEYAATGKPIVSVHPPDSDASEVLAGYPLWAPVEAVTTQAIAAAFGRAAVLVRDSVPGLTSAARRYGAAFTRQRQLGPAIDGLASLVEPPTKA